MKGQGSTEYLVIFAAVLVIALIVIFLLGQFTGFSQKSLLDQSKSALAQEIPLSIVDWSPVDNGAHNITLRIKNKDVKKIYLRDVIFDGTAHDAITPTLPKKINPGQEITVEANFSTLGLCGTDDSGQMVEFQVQLNYSYKSSGDQYTEVPATPLRFICP